MKFDQRFALLVFIETDTGLTGVGEASIAGGKFAPVTVTAVETEFAPMLIGQDPFHVEHLWQMMYWRSARHGRKGVMLNAIAGIDIALWDLMGQAAGLPLYKLLGACHDRLPAYGSGGFYMAGQGDKEIADECASYLKKGFKAIKMKVGRNTHLRYDRAQPNERQSYIPAADEVRVSLDEDIRRVHAVREAIGRDVGLAVDANCAWDRATTLRFCRETEDCNLLWLEEPVATDDVQASAELARALEVPIAGYETETGLPAWRNLITSGAVDVVQPAITYSGGFTECRRIGAVAEAFNVPYAPHSYSTIVTLAASVHLACSLPNAYVIEVDQHPNALLNELAEEPFDLASDGTIAPSDRPGLGIRLRRDILEKYCE